MKIATASTRTRVVRNHALITPESHVPVPALGWTHTHFITLIAPVMGAGFVQHLALLEAGATSAPAAEGLERFVFVMAGEVTLTVNGETTSLGEGGYALLPPGTAHEIHSDAAARLFVLEKRGGRKASVVVGREQDVEGVPFLGDPDAILRPLLPEEAGFDISMNTFAFQPGASLPLVESHVMEHGLIFLAGGGIYRLGDDWYPVTKGDAIWMGPFLPQWFGCIGKEPAKYLYYKDINFDPGLEPRR